MCDTQCSQALSERIPLRRQLIGRPKAPLWFNSSANLFYCASTDTRYSIHFRKQPISPFQNFNSHGGSSIYEVGYSDRLLAPSIGDGICDDPDDDIFIYCAISGNSRCIVSGDKELKRVSGYSGIEIISPRMFVEKYLKK